MDWEEGGLVEQTLVMIKPDAVRRNLIGRVLHMVEEARLTIRGLRMLQLSPERAREFYIVHEGKPFLDSLVQFMSSGPIVAIILEGEAAVGRFRTLAGATNPEEAAHGTIRKEMGLNIEQNSVHGSDSPESARREIEFFRQDLSWSKA
jgi:nucleoside-diphosphate kinase